MSAAQIKELLESSRKREEHIKQVVEKVKNGNGTRKQPARSPSKPR